MYLQNKLIFEKEKKGQMENLICPEKKKIIPELNSFINFFIFLFIEVERKKI